MQSNVAECEYEYTSTHGGQSTNFGYSSDKKKDTRTFYSIIKQDCTSLNVQRYLTVS
jgi:hypothetical protein